MGGVARLQEYWCLILETRTKEDHSSTRVETHTWMAEALDPATSVLNVFFSCFFAKNVDERKWPLGKSHDRIPVVLLWDY